MVIVDSTYYRKDAGVNAIQKHMEIDASDSLWIENLAIRNQYNSRIYYMPSSYFVLIYSLIQNPIPFFIILTLVGKRF